MPAIIAPMIEAIIAIVELVGAAVSFLFEALGFSVGHLASDPEPGESRFSPRRLAVAIGAPLVFLCLVGGIAYGAIAFADFRADARRENIETTRALVREQHDRLAKELAARIEAADAENLPADCQLTETDAWGNALRADYEASLLGCKLTVASAGPDEQFSTNDDVDRTTTIVLPQRAARATLDRAADALRNKLKRNHGDVSAE